MATLFLNLSLTNPVWRALSIRLPPQLGRCDYPGCRGRGMTSQSPGVQGRPTAPDLCASIFLNTHTQTYTHTHTHTISQTESHRLAKAYIQVFTCKHKQICTHLETCIHQHIMSMVSFVTQRHTDQLQSMKCRHLTSNDPVEILSYLSY